MKKFQKLLVILVVVSCNSNDNHLPMPLNKLEIGMNKNMVEHHLLELQKNGEFTDNKINTYGNEVEVEFVYCRNYKNQILQAVIYHSQNWQKVNRDLKDKIKSNEIYIDNFLIKTSYDLLPNVTIDSSVCIYSKKIEYDDFTYSFKCDHVPKLSN